MKTIYVVILIAAAAACAYVFNPAIKAEIQGEATMQSTQPTPQSQPATPQSGGMKF